jgi:hypothetical protein
MASDSEIRLRARVRVNIRGKWIIMVKLGGIMWKFQIV